MKQPLVSICCISYNHEQYIAAALESFLEQERDFELEILVHDDASTDRTAEIIRQYEAKYPEIIKGIYQTENQYSKGIRKMNHKFNFNRAAGKYIAICEGDDFWTDPEKLQKQVAYMEANPACSLCFTNALIRDESGAEEGRVFLPYEAENAPYYSKKSKEYDLGELALLGFIPTGTFFFRRGSLAQLPPFYYQNFPAGDKVLSLTLTSQGYAYCLNEVTSVYRTNVRSSVMKQWAAYKEEQLIQHYQGYLDFYALLDEHTGFRYSSQLDEAKLFFEFTILFLKRDKAVIKNAKYQPYFKKLGALAKMKIYVSAYFPGLYENMRHLRKAYNQ